MVTVRRAWSCSRSCDPTRPCYGPACPNACQGYWPDPYVNPGWGPYYNQNPPPFWGRWYSAPPRQPPPPPPRPRSPQPYHGRNSPDGTVRIGVGNVSSTDIDIDVRDNFVKGGRKRVEIGSGNVAARSNMGVIANNKSDAEELLIGVDNVARGGDNRIRVTNNDFTGFERVRIGVGNRAGGSNRIVVGGPGSDSGGPGGGWWGQRNSGWGGDNNREGQQRRRWLWW